MSGWPAFRDSGRLEELWGDPDIAAYWTKCLDAAHVGAVDTWDYQWACAVWSRGGLQVVPEVNLVRYIGCGPGAANTRDPGLAFCDLPTTPIRRPLRPPESLAPDIEADRYEHFRIFRGCDDAEAERRSLSRPR